MNNLIYLFVTLSKTLPDELILKILFEFGGLCHPVVKHLKCSTMVKAYEEKKLYREFAQLWYNTDDPNRFLFNRVFEPLSQFIGGKSYYPHPWTLNRSLKLINKSKFRECIRCGHIDDLSIARLFQFVPGPEASTFIPHIPYKSYTGGYIYLEKNYKKFMDTNPWTYCCKSCLG